ncbi:MAG TPA: HAD family phosphatase [Anaerolineae bacterium]|jgi:HAD superfamily hydrolase (TIGR01509 family)
MTIEAVVFDIGGVLVRTTDWSGRQRWEKQLGLPERGLSDLVFSSHQALLASTGRGDDKAIWRHVADTLHLSSEQLIELQRDFWSGDTADTDLIAFVRSLRPRLKTGILSNAWPEMQQLNELRFGLRDAVDHTIYSFQIGVLKPAPEAFLALVVALNVRPQNILFVDDVLANVDGARRVGLGAIHFTDAALAMDDIRVQIQHA